MARKRRILCKSEIYHIILRGNNKQIIFLDDNDRFFFLKRLQKYSKFLGIEIYAYCLMDNHVHMMVGKANQFLSNFIQRLATSYAMYFNRKYERSGHLFQGRFKSETVETESYFKTVLRYILQNPLKAGVKNFLNYRWSSSKEFERMTTNVIVEIESVLAHFKNHQQYEEYIKCKNTDKCMEYENRSFFSDINCIKIIKENYNISPSKINLMNDKDLRNKLFRELKQMGMSVNQLARITGISRKIVTFA